MDLTISCVKCMRKVPRKDDFPGDVPQITPNTPGPIIYYNFMDFDVDQMRWIGLVVMAPALHAGDRQFNPDIQHPPFFVLTSTRHSDVFLPSKALRYGEEKKRK